MKRTRNNQGFVLLLVVALLPLLGMASIVLTANSRQILTNTRRAAHAKNGEHRIEGQHKDNRLQHVHGNGHKRIAMLFAYRTHGRMVNQLCHRQGRPE